MQIAVGCVVSWRVCASEKCFYRGRVWCVPGWPGVHYVANAGIRGINMPVCQITECWSWNPGFHVCRWAPYQTDLQPPLFQCFLMLVAQQWSGDGSVSTSECRRVWQSVRRQFVRFLNPRVSICLLHKNSEQAKPIIVLFHNFFRLHDAAFWFEKMRSHLGREGRISEGFSELGWPVGMPVRKFLAELIE